MNQRQRLIRLDKIGTAFERGFKIGNSFSGLAQITIERCAFCQKQSGFIALPNPLIKHRKSLRKFALPGKHQRQIAISANRTRFYLHHLLKRGHRSVQLPGLCVKRPQKTVRSHTIGMCIDKSACHRERLVNFALAIMRLNLFQKIPRIHNWSLKKYHTPYKIQHPPFQNATSMLDNINATQYTHIS